MKEYKSNVPLFVFDEAWVVGNEPHKKKHRIAKFSMYDFTSSDWETLCCNFGIPSDYVEFTISFDINATEVSKQYHKPMRKLNEKF